MKVDQLDPQTLDRDSCDELAAVANAASAIDSPHLTAVSGAHEQSRLRYGWDDRGTDHLLVARTDAGELAAYAEIELPRWDNQHLAAVGLQTHPGQRGIGFGSALLAEALHIIDEAGRTLLLSDAWADSHRARFWERRGVEGASRAAQRRLVTAELDWAHLDRLLADSEAASAAYEIVPLPMPAPDELIPGLLDLHRAMNDAPLDDLDIEDDVWTDERLRGYELAMTHRGIRLQRLLARRLSDGALGGHTVVAVEDERPWLGFQEDTAVVRGHRGHRLGLRLKVAMLKMLADAEPQIKQIDTWNADSNHPMIAVNDALGCRVVGHGLDVQQEISRLGR